MRTSPVYYIAPSAISIIPNVNGTENDLAISVAKSTKIKVFVPDISPLRMQNASFQEWTLTGKNRRLIHADTPYTIYARLAKTNKNNGYLVFAAQTEDENDEGETIWRDPYVLSPNTSASEELITTGFDGQPIKWPPIPQAQTEGGREEYWWVKLGTISAAENGQRVLDLDTGILGTEQYNTEFTLSPDALPLRVNLSCSIDDEAVGLTPYIPWDKRVDILANLIEGWETDAAAKVVMWTIERHTGNADADRVWNEPETEIGKRIMPGGHISLSHARSADDFAGAVAATFTIVAWGETLEVEEQDESEESEAVHVIASATITILAETVASYALEVSSATVTYDPIHNSYTPSTGVGVRIRAKAQDGSVFYPDAEHISAAQLHVYYQALGAGDEDEPTELSLVGGRGNLPISAFHGGDSINIWVENGAQVELARETIAYLRFGEKGDTPISIFRWYKVGLTPVKPTDTTSEEPAPAAGDATGSTNVYPTEKWSKTAPSRPATGEWALWMCNSIKHGSGIIDAWSQPTRISGDKGEQGEDATDREYIYRRLNVFPFSGDLPKNINTGTISGQPSTDKTKDDWVPTGWSDNALPATNSEKYVYVSSREKRPGQSWSAFSDPILWSNWGVQGIDGDGVQYVYKLFDHELTAAERTSNIPSKPASPTQDGEWIPSGWSDEPLAPTTSMPFCYCSAIKKISGDWGTFGELGLWSKWAEDGKPGEVTPLCRLIPSTLLVPCTSSGVCLAAFSASVDAEMPIGASLATVTAATIVSKPSIYVGASASVAQGKAVISVTIAQGVPEANFKGVILVELTGTYLGETYTAKAGITLGASKQGGQGGQGEQGIQGEQGEQGEDAVSVFLTNEVVILSQATVSPYTIDLTTAFTEAVVIKGASPQTDFTVAVGSTYHCSASLDATNAKRVKITAIGQSGGTYYDSGYVIINVTFDGITYQKKYNFYANLLGTWKEIVVGDTKTEVAKSLSHGYDGTYTHTLDSMGQYIKSSQENVSTLQKTVGDSNEGLVKDVSEIRQIASDISLKVSRTAQANLLIDPIQKENMPFTGTSGTTGVTIDLTQFLSGSNDNVNNPWDGAGGRIIQFNVIGNTSTADGNVWPTPQPPRQLLKANTQYTFSVWAFFSDASKMSSTSSVAEISLWASAIGGTRTKQHLSIADKTGHTAGKFSQYALTFTTSDPNLYFSWLPLFTVLAGKTGMFVQYAGAKLEVGDTATDMAFDYSAMAAASAEGNVEENLLATGIDIRHKIIKLYAEMMSCFNLQGERTAYLDRMGNFVTKGIQSQLRQVVNNSSTFLDMFTVMPSSRYLPPDPTDPLYGTRVYSAKDAGEAYYDDSARFGNSQADAISVTAVCPVANVNDMAPGAGNHLIDLAVSLDMRSASGLIDVQYIPHYFASEEWSGHSLDDASFIGIYLPFMKVTGISSDAPYSWETSFARTPTRFSTENLHYISFDEIKSLIGRKFAIANHACSALFVVIADNDYVIVRKGDVVVFEFGAYADTQYERTNPYNSGTYMISLPNYQFKLIAADSYYDMMEENLEEENFAPDITIE